MQKGEPTPFTAPFSFHSQKDDRLLKKDDRVLSQTRPPFLKRRSFLSYKLFVVIYTKECINLQIKKVHYIRHIIGTPTDWFSAWSDDGVNVTIGYFTICYFSNSFIKNPASAFILEKANNFFPKSLREAPM